MRYSCISSSLSAGHARCCTWGLRMSHRCGNNPGCAAGEVVCQTDNNGHRRLSFGVDSVPQASKRVLFAGDGLPYPQHVVPIWRRFQVTCNLVTRRCGWHEQGKIVYIHGLEQTCIKQQGSRGACLHTMQRPSAVSSPSSLTSAGGAMNAVLLQLSG
jgi:hypothetical protein